MNRMNHFGKRTFLTAGTLCFLLSTPAFADDGGINIGVPGAGVRIGPGGIQAGAGDAGVNIGRGGIDAGAGDAGAHVGRGGIDAGAGDAGARIGRDGIEAGAGDAGVSVRPYERRERRRGLFGWIFGD